MPNRRVVRQQNVIVAPVDGCVVEVAQCVTSSAIVLQKYVWRITIRTKLTDHQLQTSPVHGYLLDNSLFPGMFNSWPSIDEGFEKIRPEMWNDVRDFNERRELTIQTEAGHLVLMVQLATKTARQLVCRLLEGKCLAIGDPLGMARIAGVTEIYLPAGSDCLIKSGRSVVASETILATLPSAKI
jgi:phosphatidylserine decarboxylase